MPTIVDLPDGQTANLKSPEELSNKDVKTLQRKARVAATAATKMKNAGYQEGNSESWASALFELTDDELDQIDLFQRAAVLLRLESWTLDRALPTTEDEVDDLPRPIFAPLTTAAANIGLSEEFGIDGAADPKVPTENSENSEPPLSTEPTIS